MGFAMGPTNVVIQHSLQVHKKYKDRWGRDLKIHFTWQKRKILTIANQFWLLVAGQ